MKKALILIGIPLAMVYFVGVFCLNHILWFIHLDYSHPHIQYFMSHIALCAVLMSACLKIMLKVIPKKK